MSDPSTWDERYKARLLSDLLTVGPGKPMGYLPLATIAGCGRGFEALAAELEAKGLHTRVTPPAPEGKIGSGALYVADLAELEKLIAPHRALLEASGWPTDAKGFFEKVGDVSVRQGTNPPLYVLIGRAFNDERFR